jgi:DNA-binding NarL/FixJ family response regulator
MTVRSRVVLVERDTLLREALRAVIHLERDFVLVGALRSGAAAIEGLATYQPDLLIADLPSPDGTGLEWLPDLRRLAPGVRVLVLTSFCTNCCVRAALGAGAEGYVLKDSPRQELLEAMRCVTQGQRYFSRPVAALVLDGYLQPSRAAAIDQRVTPREREVLRRVAEGESNQKIAIALRVSIKTIEKHRARLMRKLDLRNASALTVFAVRHGLLPPRTFDNEPGEDGAP